MFFRKIKQFSRNQVEKLQETESGTNKKREEFKLIAEEILPELRKKCKSIFDSDSLLRYNGAKQNVDLVMEGVACFCLRNVMDSVIEVFKYYMLDDDELLGRKIKDLERIKESISFEVC